MVTSLTSFNSVGYLGDLLPNAPQTSHERLVMSASLCGRLFNDSGEMLALTLVIQGDVNVNGELTDEKSTVTYGLP
jgi:hypothetical protein